MAKRFLVVAIFATLFSPLLYAGSTKIKILPPEGFQNKDKYIKLKLPNEVNVEKKGKYCRAYEYDKRASTLQSFKRPYVILTKVDNYFSCDETPLSLNLASYLLRLNHQDAQDIKNITPKASQNWEIFTLLPLYFHREIDDLYHIHPTNGIFFGKVDYNSSTDETEWSSHSFEGVASLIGQASLIRHGSHFSDSTAIAEAIRISYGDLTAIFGFFSFEFLREEFLKKVNYNIHDMPLVLSIASEKFFPADDEFNLKKGHEHIHLDQASQNNSLDLSKVLTAAICYAFMEAYHISAMETDRDKESKLLGIISTHMRQLLLATFIELSSSDLSFQKIAHTMFSIAANNKIYDYLAPYIETGFLEKGILEEMITPRSEEDDSDKQSYPFNMTRLISVSASGE